MWDDVPPIPPGETRPRLPFDVHVKRARRGEDKSVAKLQALFLAYIWDEVEDNLKLLCRLDPNVLERLVACVRAIEAEK